MNENKHKVFLDIRIILLTFKKKIDMKMEKGWAIYLLEKMTIIGYNPLLFFMNLNPSHVARQPKSSPLYFRISGGILIHAC